MFQLRRLCVLALNVTGIQIGMVHTRDAFVASFKVVHFKSLGHSRNNIVNFGLEVNHRRFESTASRMLI
jgi:hypothetical protein